MLLLHWSIFGACNHTGQASHLSGRKILAVASPQRAGANFDDLGYPYPRCVPTVWTSERQYNLVRQSRRVVLARRSEGQRRMRATYFLPLRVIDRHASLG